MLCVMVWWCGWCWLNDWFYNIYKFIDYKIYAVLGFCFQTFKLTDICTSGVAFASEKRTSYSFLKWSRKLLASKAKYGNTKHHSFKVVKILATSIIVFHAHLAAEFYWDEKIDKPRLQMSSWPLWPSLTQPTSRRWRKCKSSFCLVFIKSVCWKRTISLFGVIGCTWGPGSTAIIYHHSSPYIWDKNCGVCGWSVAGW